MLCYLSSIINGIVMVFRLFFLSFVNLQVYRSYSCSYFSDCDVRTEYVKENGIHTCVIRKPFVVLILEVVL
jgi:hypothetical protein